MEYIFSNKLAALKPSAIREIFKSLTDPTIISFAAGNPSPESFPVEELKALSAEIFANESTTALQYSITEGYAPLREAIAARQKSRLGENMVTDRDTTLVVTGGQQGIELSCKAFCNEGDAVICENPSFIGALNAFRSNGAKTIGVDMESDGISLSALEETLKNTPNAKLLYLIPTFQNPRGSTTSLARRKALYEIAKKHSILILEDNPYGELRFAGEEIPTIKSFDTDGIVIYAGSFSKVISPGMRVAYTIAHKPVFQKLVVCKQGNDVHTNIWAQVVCDEFISKYDFDAHLQRLRDIYTKKAEFCMELLDKYCAPEITYNRIDGGLFIWCTLPDDCDMNAFCKKAVEEYKIALVPGNAFLVNESDKTTSFRMNFSTPTDEQLTEGTRILGAMTREVLGE